MNRFRRHGNEDFEEIELPIHIIAGISDSVTGYNLFAYCDNDPVNKTDRTGNTPENNKINLNYDFMLQAVCGLLMAAVILGPDGLAALVVALTTGEAAAAASAASASGEAMLEVGENNQIHTS